MSGLVAYDSSSDDDSTAGAVPPSRRSHPVLKAHSPSIDGSNTSHKADSTDSNHADIDDSISPTTASIEQMVGPMLGPTAVTDEARSLNGTPPAIAPESMSEREAIRHLTRTSFPMSSMPPSPPGSPDPAANARFTRFLELKARNVHFNEDLAAKTSFRNPSLLSTMMARFGIAEQAQYDTSLPHELWDPTGFPEWAFREGLHKSQQEFRDQNEAGKKLLSAAGKRTIEFTSGTTSGSTSQKSTPGQHGKRRRA